MTVQVRNEAAERLLADLHEAAHGDGAATGALMLRLTAQVDEALAAERRATVERIRARLPEMLTRALPGAFLQADDLALGAEAAGRILDEEAQ